MPRADKALDDLPEVARPIREHSRVWRQEQIGGVKRGQLAQVVIVRSAPRAAIRARGSVAVAKAHPAPMHAAITPRGGSLIAEHIGPGSRRMSIQQLEQCSSC